MQTRRRSSNSNTAWFVLAGAASVHVLSPSHLLLCSCKSKCLSYTCNTTFFFLRSHAPQAVVSSNQVRFRNFPLASCCGRHCMWLVPMARRASQQPHLTNDVVRRFLGNLTLLTLLNYMSRSLQSAVWGAEHVHALDRHCALSIMQSPKLYALTTATDEPGGDLHDAISRLRLPRAVRYIRLRYTTLP